MAKVSEPALTRLFLKSCGRYKRIRHRPKGRPIVEYYTLQSVLGYLEEYSFQTGMTTFTVLDSVHRTKIIQERIPYWQKRGLYIFFFSRYSPHLNIAETMWRKLKKEWLNPEDYIDRDILFYAVNRCMAGLRHSLMMKFLIFNMRLFLTCTHSLIVFF